MEFTQDGKSLLAACGDESVFLIEPSGPEARLVADSGERTSGGRSAGYDLPGGLQLHLTTKYYQDFHKTAAITPDGLRILCRRANSTLEILDLLTELAESKLETEPEKDDDRHGVLWKAAVRCLALSPDGLHLAFADPEGKIALWDMAGVAQIAEWKAHEGSVSSLAFSPDGMMLASSAEDGMTRLWDPFVGKKLQEFGGHEGWALSVAFSPRGDLLASGGLDCVALTWDVTAARDALKVRAALPKPGLPSAADLSAAWNRLGEREGAYEAMRNLALSPE
ncbi:MAG: hypothetical protein IH959_01070, partial [Chloroflexi bacterium]|nr:hypothetical protein [Chloroflexota bacterium]